VVQAFEQPAPTGAIEAHRSRVEIREELGDPRVERSEGEEGLVTEAGEDPALRDLDRHFDLRLVARFRRPGGQNHRAVVLGEFLVGALQAGLVAARDDDPALELIADERGGDAAEEGEGALMAGDPVGYLLRERGFGVGIVRRAEDGDEELDGDPLPGRRLDEARLLAGIVDEALLAGAMELAHRQAPALEPAAIHLAELRVAVAVGMLLQVFEVEELERDARLAPLGMQVGAVRDGAMVRGRRRRPVYTRLQRLVAEGIDLRPIEPRGAGAQHRGADGAATDPQALRHLAVGAPEAPLLSQDLPCLAHGQSLGGHPSPFRGRTVRPTVPASLCCGHRPDHDAPIPVITMPIFLITMDRSW